MASGPDIRPGRNGRRRASIAIRPRALGGNVCAGPKSGLQALARGVREDVASPVRSGRYQTSFAEQLRIPRPAVPANASRIARDRLDPCSWELCQHVRMSFAYPKCSCDSYHANPTERFASRFVSLHIYYVQHTPECSGTLHHLSRPASKHL